VSLAVLDGALLRCPLALRRTGRLVAHPPRTAKLTVFYAHPLGYERRAHFHLSWPVSGLASLIAPPSHAVGTVVLEAITTLKNLRGAC